jgi:mono/diheme cytochrome c family protein
MTNRLATFAVAGILAGAFATGCTSGDQAKPGEDPLVARGRMVYQTSCTACHNSDPHKAGSVGPDLWGSNLELLTMRVLDVKYPAGYTPKRTTSQMAPLPQLKADIPAIHAYLNAP